MILSEHSRPGLAILLILAAGLLLSSQDALAKTLTLSYPLLLVVCLRYLAQSLLMLLVFAPRLGWTCCAPGGRCCSWRGASAWWA